MNQILFAIEIPPISQSSVGMTENAEWLSFLDEIKPSIATWKNAKQPLSSIWIGNADGALPFLADACTLANKHKLTYTALLLTGETISLVEP